MKVYVATSGSYDDFTIEAVFRNEEDAKAYEIADDYEAFELQEGPADVRTQYSAGWYSYYNGSDDVNVTEYKRLYDGNDRPDIQVGKYGTSPYVTVTSWNRDHVVNIIAGYRATFEAEKAKTFAA